MKMNPETKCFVTNSIHREIDIKSTEDILGEFFPIGNPKKANADKGKRFFEAVSQQLANLIKEVSELDLEKRYE